MRTTLLLANVILLCSYPVVRAFNGVSAGMALEYNPIAKLSYPNSGDAEYEIVDNITWEPGVYYNFSTGFRAGTFFDLYKKTLDMGGTVSRSKLSSWGIGMLGDYAYEMTESGGSLLVAGMEIGYGEFKDDNEHAKRSGGSVWVAGIGGLRFYFTPSFSIELDYRIKWHQYDMTGTPAKSYDFSGSTIRISVGYGLYSSEGKGDNSSL
jgi:hypothetical protein